LAVTEGFFVAIFFVSLSFHMTLDIFPTLQAMIVAILLAATVGMLTGAGLLKLIRHFFAEVHLL
jgi:hypothetical protein